MILRGWHNRARLRPMLGRVLLLLAVLALIGAALTLAVPGVLAAFSSATSNANNVLGTTVLGAPTGLAAAPVGYDVGVSWNAGTNGTGYQILGAANGTSSNCTGAPFGMLSTSATTSYTDTSRSTPQGTYYCYQVKTAYGASWTSVTGNPTSAAQLGVVASTVQMTNNGDHSACSGSGSQQYGQSGKLDCGDQIIINFNQPINPATGPSGTNSICPSQLLLLGSTTTAGGCGTALVYSGSYTGNGVDDRPITGVGFRPDVVIVKSAGSATGVIRTSSWSGTSKDMVDDTGLSTDRIQSLDADGFTIGTHANVNANGTTYYWVAFKQAPGELVLGSYTGNGSSSRDITGLGFQPDWVMTIPAGNPDPDGRWSEFGGNQSIQFWGGTGFESDHIKTFLSDGFRVGNVEEQNTNGATYYYVAWKHSDRFASGTYTGNGNDDRYISSPGWRPEFVAIYSPSGQTHVFRNDAMGGRSVPFGTGGYFWNGIESLYSSGFEVGTDATVNTNGNTYYWTAWKESLPATVSNPGETLNLGLLGGGTISACNCRFNATYAWSNNNRTLTITVGAMSAGSTYPTLSGTWTFYPSTNGSKVQSATGAYHVCDTNGGGGNCLPTTSSNP